MTNKLFITSVGLLTSLLIFTSCNNKKSESASITTTEKIMQVDDLLNEAENLVGKTVRFEGVCTHICKHGGKKMFLMGSDDSKTIRVDANKEIGSFSADVTNNIVEVTGILVEERIDESAILLMEEQQQQSTRKHSKGESGGCATEKSAHGQKQLNSFEQRMQDYRNRIQDRKAKEGKDYLSFYSVNGKDYKIK